jgi:ElaB/YqjD/DUF883 family membrane-anchored ribosome-binding protein
LGDLFPLLNRAEARRKVATMIGRTEYLESGLGVQVDDVKEKVLELTATAREQMSVGAHFLRESIVKQPVRALGIALGMGVILGWLIKRR